MFLYNASLMDTFNLRYPVNFMRKPGQSVRETYLLRLWDGEFWGKMRWTIDNVAGSAICRQVGIYIYINNLRNCFLTVIDVSNYPYINCSAVLNQIKKSKNSTKYLRIDWNKIAIMGHNHLWITKTVSWNSVIKIILNHFKVESEKWNTSI